MKGIQLGGLLACVLLLSIPPVFAAETSPTPSPAQEKVVAKLSAAKLAICKKREGLIKSRSARMSSKANELERTFNELTSKVQSYYQTQLVPQGKTVANYAELNQALTEKREALRKAQVQAHTDYQEFSCDSENPKQALRDFNSDMQTVHTDLNDYKAALTTMITALKKAAQ